MENDSTRYLIYPSAYAARAVGLLSKVSVQLCMAEADRLSEADTQGSRLCHTQTRSRITDYLRGTILTSSRNVLMQDD